MIESATATATLLFQWLVPPLARSSEQAVVPRCEMFAS